MNNIPSKQSTKRNQLLETMNNDGAKWLSVHPDWMLRLKHDRVYAVHSCGWYVMPYEITQLGRHKCYFCEKDIPDVVVRYLNLLNM